MIDQIKDLNTFVRYCKNQIDAENFKQTEIERILTNLLISQATVYEFVENVNDVIEVYYKFLKIAIKREQYEICDIMHKSLNIELKHFKKIASKCNFEDDVMECIEDINKFYKERYIDAN